MKKILLVLCALLLFSCGSVLASENSMNSAEVFRNNLIVLKESLLISNMKFKNEELQEIANELYKYKSFNYFLITHNSAEALLDKIISLENPMTLYSNYLDVLLEMTVSQINLFYIMAKETKTTTIKGKNFGIYLTFAQEFGEEQCAKYIQEPFRIIKKRYKTTKNSEIIIERAKVVSATVDCINTKYLKQMQELNTLFYNAAERYKVESIGLIFDYSDYDKVAEFETDEEQLEEINNIIKQKTLSEIEITIKEFSQIGELKTEKEQVLFINKIINEKLMKGSI